MSLSKFKRRLHRWLPLLKVVGITIVLILLIWAGIRFGEDTQADTQQANADFGDSRTSEVSRALASKDYEGGLSLIEEGDFNSGRAVMQRLAPLVAEGVPSRGEARAHFWMAQDYLRDRFDWAYLQRLPDGLLEGQVIQPPELNEPDDRIEKVFRHLRAALELKPSFVEARKALSAFLIANERREDAIEVLVDGFSQFPEQGAIFLELLAHAWGYPGDDLAWRQKCWLEYSTKGRQLVDGHRSDLPLRLSHAIYAVLVGEPEFFEFQLEGLKRDFADSENVARWLPAFAAFPHYHSAIGAARAAQGGDLSQVLDQLLQARQVFPDSVTINDVILQVLDHQPKLKSKVVIDGVGSGYGAVLLAALEPSSKEFASQVKALDAFDQEVRVRFWWVEALPEADRDANWMKLARACAESRQLALERRLQVRRCLANYQLARNQWREALAEFEYLRDHRALNSLDRSKMSTAYRKLGLTEAAEFPEANESNLR